VTVLPFPEPFPEPLPEPFPEPLPDAVDLVAVDLVDEVLALEARDFFAG